MNRLLRLCAILVAAALIPACGGGGSSFPAPGGVSSGTAVGLSGNILVFFSPSSPSALSGLLAVSGLAAGENLVGIDYRPADGLLYGVAVNGTNMRLYSVNPNTGVATALGAGPFAHTSGARYGVDFNPVVDRLRVVNSSDGNLRSNVATGLANIDTNLNPAAQDVSGIAYSNNFSGAVTTTLYAVSAAANSLVTIGSIDGTPTSPNTGQIFTVGVLGITLDAGSGVGFDITSTGIAYATLQIGGVTQLYTINLATGAATLVGTVGPGSIALQGLAIVP